VLGVPDRLVLQHDMSAADGLRATGERRHQVRILFRKRPHDRVEHVLGCDTRVLLESRRIANGKCGRHELVQAAGAAEVHAAETMVKDAPDQVTKEMLEPAGSAHIERERGGRRCRRVRYVPSHEPLRGWNTSHCAMHFAQDSVSLLSGFSNVAVRLGVQRRLAGLVQGGGVLARVLGGGKGESPVCIAPQAIELWLVARARAETSRNVLAHMLAHIVEEVNDFRHSREDSTELPPIDGDVSCDCVPRGPLPNDVGSLALHICTRHAVGCGHPDDVLQRRVQAELLPHRGDDGLQPRAPLLRVGDARHFR